MGHSPLSRSTRHADSEKAQSAEHMADNIEHSINRQQRQHHTQHPAQWSPLRGVCGMCGARVYVSVLVVVCCVCAVCALSLCALLCVFAVYVCFLCRPHLRFACMLWVCLLLALCYDCGFFVCASVRCVCVLASSLV